MELEKNEWKITSDTEADWALKKIKDSDAEFERLKKIADDTIDDTLRMLDHHKESHDNEVAYLKAKLEEYFNTVPHKKTKTQESYKLLSGSLVRKRGTEEFHRDDKVLIDYLSENYPCYLKYKTEVNWSELKKDISPIQGACYLTETGEEVPGIEVTMKPDTFTVK